MRTYWRDERIELRRASLPGPRDRDGAQATPGRRVADLGRRHQRGGPAGGGAGSATDGWASSLGPTRATWPRWRRSAVMPREAGRAPHRSAAGDAGPAAPLPADKQVLPPTTTSSESRAELLARHGVRLAVDQRDRRLPGRPPVARRHGRGLERLHGLLRTATGSSPAGLSTRYEVADVFEAQELFRERGWTDGLPIVAPTAERVEACSPGLVRPPTTSSVSSRSRRGHRPRRRSRSTR